MEWVLARMWEAASGEQQVGTDLELTFWVERGAFTLLSQRRGSEGGEKGQSDALLEKATAAALNDVRALVAR